MVIHETEAPGELIYSGPNIMMGYASNRSDLLDRIAGHQEQFGGIRQFAPRAFAGDGHWCIDPLSTVWR